MIKNRWLWLEKDCEIWKTMNNLQKHLIENNYEDKLIIRDLDKFNTVLRITIIILNPIKYVLCKSTYR